MRRRGSRWRCPWLSSRFSLSSGKPDKAHDQDAEIGRAAALDMSLPKRPNSSKKRSALMPIIDSQIHAYEANTPKRPWDTVPNWPPHVTGDEMVAAMKKVGVDGAIFISAFSMYRYDASYAVEVQRAHPGKFGIVKPVDPDDPDVADVIADWKKIPGAVGIRLMLWEKAA